MTWVIDNSKQTGLGFVTLLMIANHANAEGRQAFPSMKTLARECRTSLRSVQRVVLKLERSGELGVHRSSGRTSHSYSLPLMPNVDTVSTLPTHQRRQPDHVKSVERRHPDHVDNSERGHTGHVKPINVDTVGFNVDIAMSTEPINHKEKKEPSAHAELISFHAGFLDGPIPDQGAQGKAVKTLLENYSTQDCRNYYLHLRGQEWRDTPVTWLTVKHGIGDWLARGRPSNVNGNGSKPKVELDPFGEPFIRKDFTWQDAAVRCPEKNADDIRLHFEGKLEWKDVRDAA